MIMLHNRTPDSRRSKRLSFKRTEAFHRKMDTQGTTAETTNPRLVALPKRKRGKMKQEDRFLKTGRELVRSRIHGTDTILPHLHLSPKTKRRTQRKVVDFYRWHNDQRGKQLDAVA